MLADRVLVCPQARVRLCVAEGFWARARGLIGRANPPEALLFEGTRSVHTLAMSRPIDVAYCKRSGLASAPPVEYRVIDRVTMRPWRLSAPRWSADAVIESEAGSMFRWGVGPGSLLRVELDADAVEDHQ